MELFKSKESWKKKKKSNNNWKTAWPGMILEWHLFLRLSLGFVRKMLSFIGKYLSFYPTDVCSFSAFYELNQQVSLIKYVENEISNSTSLKKKKERKKKQKREVLNFESYCYFKWVTFS